MAPAADDELDPAHVWMLDKALDDKLVAFLVQTGTSQADAGDIVAVVEDALRKRLSRADDPVTDLVAYAFKTVINARNRGIRGDTRRARREARFAGGGPCASPDPFCDVERSDVIQTILAVLPRRQREALWLRYVLDLPRDEVAEWMQIGLETVKTHITRGLAQLRNEDSVRQQLRGEGS